jgi:hypothetical protein
MHRLVGHPHMERIAVGVRIDRDRLIPILRAVLITRQAISPRLAIRIFLNMGVPSLAAGHARPACLKRKRTA